MIKENTRFKRFLGHLTRILRAIWPVLLVFAIVFIFSRYVVSRSIVSGDSMTPTLEDGQNLLMDRVFYKKEGLQRFDIIVFNTGEKDETGLFSVNYVKRVIGLPGETIAVRGGFVYINGERLSNDIYGKEYMRDSGGSPYEMEEFVIPENEYFVLGDNRNNSMDSRKIGTVKSEAILGKAFFRIWPITKMGPVQ